VDVLDLEARVPGSIFVAKPYVPSLVGRVLASAMKASVARTSVANTRAVKPAAGRVSA